MRARGPARTVGPMPDIVALIVAVIGWVVVIAGLVGLIDVARRPADAFTAADRQTKPFWLIMLALATALPLVGFAVLGLLGLVAVVVVAVYYADVRPRLVEVTRR